MRLTPLLISMALCHSALAAETIDYRRDVKPLLITHCSSCHGALKQEGELRLDAISLIRRGGSSGPAIKPGQPANSLILDALLGRNSRTPMPPKKAGRRLTKAEIGRIESWIRSGAKAPDEPIPVDPRKHWAYQLPQPSKQFTGNPIDSYFQALHRRRSIKPVGSANRHRLIRRMYLDIVGIPPTVEELRRFSQSPQLTGLVDHLLSSPHYGERWGRHWMDIWRYTDWFGLGAEVRYSQKNIWRWRQWIVQALNQDKGYDRMVMEMLAADELYPLDKSRLAATGFLARNWYLFNRNFWLDDVVQHTSKAFLGITANCARCHDHKYDPISQREYYQLRAFFEPHRVRMDRWDKDQIPRVFDKDLQAKTYLFVRGDEQKPDRSRSLLAQTPRVLGAQPDIQPVKLPVTAWYPGLNPQRIQSGEKTLQDKIRDLEKRRRETQRLLTSADEALKQFAAGKKTTKPHRQTAVRYDGKFLFDDFRSRRPTFWKFVGANNEYTRQGVVHTNLTGGQSRFVTQQVTPRDLAAELTFEILAGNTRSIGFGFDLDKQGWFGVFASPTGNKVQIYVVYENRESYPSGAIFATPVKNKEKYTLAFAVRGQQVNVWFNHRLVIAHKLKLARRRGKLAVTCYQAKVRYSQVRMKPLPMSFTLANSTAEKLKPPFTRERVVTRKSLAETIQRLRARLAHIGPETAVAQLSLAAFRARARAEQARFGLVQGDPQALAVAASAAESRATRAAAELQLADSQAGLAGAASANEKRNFRKRIQAARIAIAQANKRLQSKSTSYKTFGMKFPKTSTGRRTALAKWIASRKNPLTARVAVNHIWTRHFGQPLVHSLFDFGLRSPKPLHQELLDHLAVELMQRKWSMKWLHRTILLSQTYQRSSLAGNANLRKLDPDNRLYWRMNTQRMQAEVIRDSMIAIAGQLDPKVGGPDMDNKMAETGKRRTIYYRYARSDRYNLFDVFDGPSVEECYRRRETIVPHQSLALVNGKLAAHWSNQIARRITQRLQDPTAIIRHAFLSILGREPTQQEQEICRQAFTELAAESKAKDRIQNATRHLVHVLLNHNDFIAIR